MVTSKCLIYRSRQVHPLNYKKDCEDFLGAVLPHDDSSTDRSEGSKLDTCFVETEKAWFKYYKEPYLRYGAMYRGESPAGKLASVSDDRMKEIGSVYNVKFVLDTNMYL